MTRTEVKSPLELADWLTKLEDVESHVVSQCSDKRGANSVGGLTHATNQNARRRRPQRDDVVPFDLFEVDSSEVCCIG